MKFNMSSVKETYSSKDVIKSYVQKQKKTGITEPERRIIEKTIKPQNRILDIGCGTGRVCFGLYEMGFENIVGIDISEEMIQNAIKLQEKRSKIKFVNHDILVFKGELGTFDVVLAIHSITPIPKNENRRNALSQIAKYLNSNGVVIISAFLQETNKDYWEEEKIKWDGMR